MESRIRQIDAIIRNHEIVERDETAQEVGHTSIVTLRYEGDDEDDTQEFFLGSIEEKPDGIPVVSPTSPLGEALLGKKAGDDVAYDAPSGPLRVTIVSIR